MTATPGLNVGVKQFAYYNSATFASPVWVPIPMIVDVDLNLGKSKANANSRVSTWAMTLPAIKTGPLEFTIKNDTSQATYDILRNAWLNDTLMDFAIADQSITQSGCEYWRAQYYVYEFPISQKLEEAESGKVVCDLGYSTNLPSFTNVP